MNEIDLINTYLNLIYTKNTSTFKRLLNKHSNVICFHEWLSYNKKSFQFVNNLLKEDNYTWCVGANNISMIQAFMKDDCDSEFDNQAKNLTEKYQVIFLSGKGDSVINKAFLNLEYIKSFENDLIDVFHFREEVDFSNLSLYEPYYSFMDALYQIDTWPGILVIYQSSSIYFDINKLEDVDSIFRKIKEGSVFDNHEFTKDDSYFIQLSDLHLGPRKRDDGLSILYEFLDDLIDRLPTNNRFNFLITGDLMDTPNRANMYKASSALKRLKQNYDCDVTFILGNHDVMVKGVNIFRKQKSKVINYLLSDNIKVIDSEKIIIIKIDTTSLGNFARGKVDEIQLDEIDKELASIKNLNKYCLLAMLHHHPYKIEKEEFLKIKWNERVFIGNLVEKSKALVNSEVLIKWLKKHNIHYVFHGHKHVANFSKREDSYVIACGSSTGGGAKEKNSSYVCYNLVKYSRLERKFKYCMIFYDDMTKQSRHRVVINYME